MKKQFLLVSAFIILIGSSAVMLSRKADQSFSLESEKGSSKSPFSKAKNFAAAAKWRYDRLKDENGNYYPFYTVNALHQADNYRSVSRSNGLGLAWQELGPDNVGGRTRAILIDKRDTTNNTIYAGGVSGGMWKSTDGAVTWTRLSGFYNWMGIACIAQAPAPDYSIYIGTGVGLDGTGSYYTGTSFASARYGDGIFKLNAVDSPVLITPDVMVNGFYNPTSNLPWYDVNRIAVNQANPSQIIAATLVGLQMSNDAGATWQPIAFTGSLSSANNVMFDDVKWSKDGNNIYATEDFGSLIYSNDGGSTWAAEVSSVNSGWTSQASSRIELALAPSDPNVVYALMANTQPGGGTLGVFKSADAGNTWITVALGGPLFLLFEEGSYGSGGQGGYDNTIAVSPADPNKIYMGGVAFYTGDANSGVQPADYGYSDESNPYYMHPDKHAIVIADNNPDLMFIGCDGGIFKSIDAYTDFPSPTYTVRNRGYNVTQNYGIGASIDGTVLGGSQDNGTNYIDYYHSSLGASIEVLGGDGFENAVSQVDPDWYFGAIYYGALYRSSSHGSSQSSYAGYFDVKVDPAGMGNPTVCGAQADEDAQFNTPYILSETTNAANGINQVAYVASDRAHSAGEVVAVTSNTGNYQFDVTLSQDVAFDSSVLVGDPVRSRVIMATNCGVFVTSDALNKTIIPRWFRLLPSGNLNDAQWFVSTPGADTLYVCTSNGTVYRFSNFNAHADTATYPPGNTVGVLYSSASEADVSSFTIDGSNPLRDVEGIDVDPADNNHIVAVIAGFASSAKQPHVYESHDAGATWGADTAGLPNMPVYTVRIHDANTFIIGTEFGIWTWDGSSWHEDNGNMERVPVYKIIERNLYENGCEVLYIGTHGRGMWRCTTLTNPSCQTSIGTGVNNVKPNAISGLNVFPNPVNNSAKISLSLDNSASVTLRVFDMTGKLMQEVTHTNAPAGQNLFDLNASGLGSGNYLLVATVADTRTLSRLFVVTK